MKPSEIKEGTKLFFVFWDPYLLVHKVTIVEIIGFCESWLSKHVCLKLVTIIGEYDFNQYEIYQSTDLNYIYCEVFDYDDCVFITCNEQLLVELLKQLVENKTYDPCLVRRFLYYD